MNKLDLIIKSLDHEYNIQIMQLNLMWEGKIVFTESRFCETSILLKLLSEILVKRYDYTYEDFMRNLFAIKDDWILFRETDLPVLYTYRENACRVLDIILDQHFEYIKEKENDNE